MRRTLFICLIFVFASTLAQEFPKNKVRDSLLLRLHGYQEQGVQDSAIYYMDKWVKQQISVGKSEVVAYSSKISLLLSYQRYDEAFREAMAVHDRYCESPSPQKRCKECLVIYNHLRSFLNTMGRHEEAMFFLRKRCKGIPFHNYEYKLALQHVLIGRNDSAFALAKQNTIAALESGQTKDIFSAYNIEGLVYRSAGEFQKARTAFRRALRVGEQGGYSRSQLFFIEGNLGSTLLRLKELDSARYWLTRDAAESLNRGEMNSFTTASASIAEIDLLENKHADASKRLNDLLANYTNYIPLSYAMRLDTLLAGEAENSNHKVLLQTAIQWSKFVEERVQNEDQAGREFQTALESKILEQTYQQMLNEKELTKQKLAVVEAQRDKDTLQKWLLVSLFGGLAIIAMLMFWRYRSIHKRKEIIDKMEKDILAKEREILELRVAEESESVKRLALELNAKKEFSGALMDKLQQVESMSNAELRNIEMFIHNELDIKSSRVQVESDLNAVSQDFYMNLKRAHSGLTEADLKLAALVVLKTSNKEIAISRNITPNSVKITKNRLKKKLNLTASDDLYVFLDKYL